MTVETTHPLYDLMAPDWEQVRDTYAGSRAVKLRTTVYLPATDGMVQDGYGTINSAGQRAYDAYLIRAVFHSFYSDAVDGLVGIMHREPAAITVPERMKPLLQNLTVDGEDVHALLRKINLNQLKNGRFGLLVEVPSNQPVDKVQPYIATYVASRIINWDQQKLSDDRRRLNMVVLDESDFERISAFEWDDKGKWRVLKVMPDGSYGVAVVTEENSNEPPDEAFKIPSLGGQTLTDIPFFFVNSKDIVPDPEQPPLMNLSNLSLAIYRGEADYRQCLFMQGQETLVISGATTEEEKGEERRVGAGAKIELPMGGDAKFIGVTAEGLAEMRSALENDKDLAAQMGARMLSAKGGERASGDALRVRVAAQTASLVTIARSGAFALELALKVIAKWMGLNPDEVKVRANEDFTDDILDGDDLVKVMDAKNQGAPLSNKSIHRWLKKKDMTELEFEEEQALADAEREEAMARGLLEDKTKPEPEPEEPSGDEA